MEPLSQIKPQKYIYHFGPTHTEGSEKDRNLLGNKGANLAEMSRLGLQVPPGFTLSSELCGFFLKEEQSLKEIIQKPLEEAISNLETVTGKTFNSGKNPLLLSIRSGAAVSMPGMMDSILNLGLNDKTVKVLGDLCQDERFAWDSYRRFIQMYSSVVMKMNSSLLEVHLDDYKKQKSYQFDSDLSAEEWKQLVSSFKESILQNTGQLFPEEPWEQLWTAIEAVFKSWNNPRALVYRQMNGASSEIGTAVNVQAMVFGNRGEDCATGVVFTRNPSTGEKALFGEFLQNAQGEDVVAGIRTPSLIINQDFESQESKNQELKNQESKSQELKNQDSENQELKSQESKNQELKSQDSKSQLKNSSHNPSQNKGTKQKDLKTLLPENFKQLEQLCHQLEKHYKYVQDIEFTIEKGKLWLLQTRNAKCSPKAQLKVLFALKEEGILTEEELLLKTDPSFLNTLLHPSIDETDSNKALVQALPASPGAAVGQVVFDNETALDFDKKSKPVILVRTETSPEDINGMIHSQGILTLKGGMTSHAAVVARSMGKPCIVGCESAVINESKKELYLNNQMIKEGDFITLDGSSGNIFLGQMKMKETGLDDYFFKIMKLSDKYAGLKVRANAETPTDVQKAKEFGAKGLGLCRTEHMFFQENRINIMRKMILSESLEERQFALNELFVMQEKDFYDIFKIMSPYPVTVRLLDPPLHEFLPQKEKDIQALSDYLEIDKEDLSLKIKNLNESNPMLGHRGCRLAITFPEIYLMQIQAILSAMERLLKEKQKLQIEIMIPLVCETQELKFLKKLIQAEIEKKEKELSIKFPILIGTMIELPRACLIANELAKEADFFSFGTNDLTQTVFGFSRDDTGKFLPSYIQKNILKQDPFSSLDKEGVGSLMKIAIEKAKKTKKDIKLGICGEQGGDAKSLSFFQELDLGYVSCSPYRVPIARLVSARNYIQKKRGILCS